jgi:Family of unknown function (DUF6153)
MLLVALVGLFVMHGLSDHGASAHVPMPAAGSVSADHSVAPAMSDPAMVAEDDSSGHSELGLAGLCMAVLVAAVLGFAFLRRRVMAYLGWWSPRLVRRWPRPVGRDRDPPDLVRLSIQRC